MNSNAMNFRTNVLAIVQILNIIKNPKMRLYSIKYSRIYAEFSVEFIAFVTHFSRNFQELWEEQPYHQL